MKPSLEGTPFIVGVALGPIERLGPQAWLPHYSIICFNNPAWVERPSVEIISLKAKYPGIRLSRKNLTRLLSAPEFRETLASLTPAGGKPWLLVQKNRPSIAAAAKALNANLIANPPELSLELENKLEFRRLFADNIRLPPYQLLTPDDYHDAKSAYKSLAQRFSTFVLQAQLSSAGRHTRIIRDFESFQTALKFFAATRPDETLIASQFITGANAAIQGCVTRHGIFSYGLMQHVVNVPEAEHAGGAGRFAGHQFGSAVFSAAAEQQADALVQTLGEKLKARGYRGIFGLDVIVDEQDNIFTLEINPRLTGATLPLTLLALAAKHTPFLQMHILEFTQPEYPRPREIPEAGYPASLPSASHFIFQNYHAHDIKIARALPSGIYTFTAGQLTPTQKQPWFHNLEHPEELLLLGAGDREAILKPGQQFVRILTRQALFTGEDQLNERGQQLVQHFEQKYLRST